MPSNGPVEIKSSGAMKEGDGKSCVPYNSAKLCKSKGHKSYRGLPLLLFQSDCLTTSVPRFMGAPCFGVRYMLAYGTPFDSIPIPTRGITHGTVRVKARNQRRKAHNWDKVNKGCQPGPLGHVKGSPQLIRGHWRLQIAVGSPLFSTSVPQNHKPAAIIRTLGGSLERRIQVPSKRHTRCIGGNLDLPGPAGQLKAYR